MKYTEFESIISPERMRKYNVACGGNTAKAMTLYRYNLRLSQEMFVVVSCFEVALRNRIDAVMKAHHEPICFSKNPVSIDTQYIHNRYNRIMELFRWMGIDGASLLYGLGHIDNACNQIDALIK